MSSLERLEQIEERLMQSFRKNRFDTFNQLLFERLQLLKEARKEPGSDAFLETARLQTDQWKARLCRRIETLRRIRLEANSVSGYGSVRAPRPGRVINRSL